MYMIVECGGKQFQVQPDATIKVPLLHEAPGSVVSLDKVLLVRDETGVVVGRPFVEGAQVKATVVAHGRGPKLRCFKFKRRKNYRRRWGHRQDYTELKITQLVVPERVS